MKLSRKLLGYLSLVIIIGALGAGVYYRLRPEPEASEASEATSSETALPASASQQFATDVPQPVVGAEVVRDTLWITVTAAGDVPPGETTLG